MVQTRETWDKMPDVECASDLIWYPNLDLFDSLRFSHGRSGFDRERKVVFRFFVCLLLFFFCRKKRCSCTEVSWA